MSKISWDSVSITNYFSNSLGNLKNTTCSSIYNNIGDYKLIKSGKYKKLISAYYDKLENDKASEATTDKNSTNNKDKTETTSSKKKTNALDTAALRLKAVNKDAVALDISKFTSSSTKKTTTATSSNSTGTNFDTTI